MEGKKNDRPKWINDVFAEFLKMVLLNNDIYHAVDYLRKCVRELEEQKVDPHKLKIWIELSRDPADYKVSNMQKKIGLQLGAKAGDLIHYYKSDNPAGVSVNFKDISLRKYKVMLWKTVKDILEIIKCDLNILPEL